MASQVLKYIILSLVLLTGCNRYAFIDDADRLNISVSDTVFPDTGGTRQVYMDKDDWTIDFVVLTDYIGKHDHGNVIEGESLRQSTRMEMKGFGEIWLEYLLGGFRIIRNEDRSMTVSMEPNLTYYERTLTIILRCGIETLELQFTQKASEGIVIDRVEWDPPLSSSSSTRKIVSQYTLEREIYIYEDMSIGNTVTSKYYVISLLDAHSVMLPIPDASLTDGQLTFSGDSIQMDRNNNSYKIPVENEDIYPGSISGAYVKYISYMTNFHIHMKHVKDDSITLCFTGKFNSNSPDIRK